MKLNSDQSLVELISVIVLLVIIFLPFILGTITLFLGNIDNALALYAIQVIVYAAISN